MSFITTKRKFPVFTFLALVFLLCIASLNLSLLKGVINVPNKVLGGCDHLPSWQRQLTHLASLPPVAGRQKESRRFLAIGIPTVYRDENYLHTTLQSLVNNSCPEEQNDAVVIIYLADTDQTKKEKQLHLIRRNFQASLDSGFLQVIESSPEIYPTMDFALTKRTYDDPVDRVLWRTKQTIDFAFLFTYAKSKSNYYLILEDDVISSTEYINVIKDYIAFKANHHWIVLRFADFDGIGVLLHNSNLEQFVQFLLLFHQEQPWDILLGQFISLQVPEQMLTRRLPSIFQHIGWNSTLTKKVQPLLDNSFDLAERKFKNHNPPAHIVTTIRTNMENIPQYAYQSAPGMFRGIVRPNQTFDIVLKEPQPISRIVILTGVRVQSNEGNVSTMIYTIQEGNVEVSSKFYEIVSNTTAISDSFTLLSEFIDGEVDIVRENSNLLNWVQCIRINIGPGQAGMIAIREIEIFS